MSKDAPSLGNEMFERFEIDQKMRFGEGGYGITFRAYDRKTEEDVAVKVVDSRRTSVDSLVKECEFMERVQGNEHIIKLLAHGLGINHNSHLYFIFMERASGGELFDQLTTHNGAVPEAVTRDFASQLCDGLAHCHARGVAHRDIKLENVLLNDKGVIKLIDFGLSHQYPLNPQTGVADRSKPIKGFCGSKSYAAPEVLNQGLYDGFEADMWSLGVSLFGLLNGFFPVDEAKLTDWRFQKLVRAQQDGLSSVATILGWYKKTPAHLSQSAINLLNSLLNIDPHKRPSIEEVMKHPFITGRDKVAPGEYDVIEPLHYRGSGMQPASLLFSEEMEIIDEPVYRSISNAFEEKSEEEPKIPPGLVRQAAFGGVDSLGDLRII